MQLRVCRRVRRCGGGWQQRVHPELPGAIAGGDQDARHLHLRLHLRPHFHWQGAKPPLPSFDIPLIPLCRTLSCFLAAVLEISSSPTMFEGGGNIY